MYEEIQSLSGCDLIKDLRSSEPFHRVIHFFHKLAVKQGNDINFTDEHTPKFVKLMHVSRSGPNSNRLTDIIPYLVVRSTNETNAVNESLPKAMLALRDPSPRSEKLIHSRP